ncbi:MAG: MFS transporter [Chloroflexi bacterium]|nr:MFS transporter [Chloroflexota bacterium]
MPANTTATPSNGGPPRFVALGHRDFRLIWLGQLISTIGSEMQFIAVNWHVFELLRGQSYVLSFLGSEIEVSADALGLGSLGLVRVIPIVIFALLGGTLADTYNRRRLLLWTQSAAALFAGLLAVLTLTGRDSLVAIYLLTAAGAAAQALDNPARQSLVPNLVPAHHLTNAVSLNTLTWHVGSIVGPAIAGVLVGRFNVGLVYAMNAVSFGAVIVALLLMHYRGEARRPAGTGLNWRSVVEGLRFVHGSRIIWSTMLLDFVATLFSSARTMLPIVATDLLGLDAQGYGLLATAQPVGSVITSVVLAMRGEIKRQGVILLVSVAVYGLATALFGISTVFIFSYVFFALTGAADTVSTVIRNTIRQLSTPDRLRGRMTGVNMIFFMGGPQLGELEAGLVAAVFGVSFAIFSGGLATVLFTLWVAWRYPRLRHYASGEHTPATVSG